MQVLDGITAAQTTMAVVKRLTGTAAKVAKLDIKAAFDSVSHAAAFQWLMACEPCAEAVGLMNLCFGTSVQLGFGGVEKTLPMSKGIMQGSAYSADLFSRIMDWYLAPVAERFGEQFPGWEEKIRGLPHFLIYADDLIVFSDTEAGLRAITEVLRTIGLVVNPEKCRVLNDVGGTCPGIWLPRHARPLQGEDHLLFLGVPLGHTAGTQLVMSHLLRKTSNTYFGFNRLLDDGATPLALRFQLFESYIAAKWQWAAPAMYPDTRSLKTIEGNKNTDLLSLCRVGTDPLLPWLENTVSRRRAVRLACMIAKGPDWRRMWLCRLWNYYGHLARSPIQHPMRVLLNVCSSSNLRRGLKASWVSDLPIRKLQKICAVIAPDHVRAAAGLWEVCAQDRKVWQKLQKEWLQHWLPKSREPQPTVEYLLQRQLVLLKRKSAAEQMFLRPARDVLEAPYRTGAMIIAEAPKQPTSAIWLLQEGDGCQLVLMLQGQDVRHAISVQVRPYDASPLGQALALLTTGAKLVSLLESFGRPNVRLIAPAAVYRRDIFQETVALGHLADLAELKRVLDLLPTGTMMLRPQKLSDRVSRHLARFMPVPMPTKYLLRTVDFGHAVFGEDFRTVHRGLWQLLNL